MSGCHDDRVPLGIPEMPEECPVCIEALFDANGIAQIGEEVAKILWHSVHTDCLERASEPLNGNGQRNGVGG